jgi:large repetitive protein
MKSSHRDFSPYQTHHAINPQVGNMAISTFTSISARTLTDTSAQDDFSSFGGTLVATSTVTGAVSFSVTGPGVSSVSSVAGYTTQVTSTYGVLHLNTTSGAYLFEPNDAAIQGLRQGQNVLQSFGFTATDSSGASHTHDLRMTFTGANERPVLTLAAAQPQIVAEALDATAQDIGPVTGNLVINDGDIGNTLTASVLGTPSFSLSGGGSLTTAQVTALREALATGKLSFDAPATSDGGAQTLGYRWDPSAANLDFLKAGQSLNIVYTVRVSDGATNSNTATLSFKVEGTNDAAVITGATAGAVVEAGGVANALAGTVRTWGDLNATDVDGTASFRAVAAGTASEGGYGTYAVNSTGGWVYTLNNTHPAVQALAKGAVMNDTVVVKTADGTEQIVTIKITGTNDAPVAAADAIEVREDSAIVRGSVATNDTDVDAGARLTFSRASGQAAVPGLVFGADGSYSFDPRHSAYQNLNAGETRVVEFTYLVKDENGAYSTAKLAITVTGTNDKPVAASTVAPVQEDTVITGRVTATDADAGQTATLSYALTGAAPTGLTFNADGSYTFDAAAYDSLAAGQVRTIWVPYQATDANGATSNIASIKLVITGTNDEPVARAAAASVPEDQVVSGRVYAADADYGQTATLTYAVVGTPPVGVVMRADGTYTFDAASYDSLGRGETYDVIVNFTATDASGGTSEPQSLVIKVTGTNDTPVAAAASDVVVEDASITGRLTATDAESGDLSYALAGVAPVGFSMDAQGHYSFDASAYDRLPAGETLQLSVAFTATDALGATSAPAKLIITLTGTNDVPAASAAMNSVSEDGVVAGQVTGIDADKGAVLTYALTSAAPTGLEFKADGSYTFDASTYDHLTAGEQHVITVDFTAFDGTETSESAELKITITGTNDVPVATTATDRVTEDSTVTGSVMASDAEAGTLNFAAVGPVPVGFALNRDGSYRFDASSYDGLPAGETMVVNVAFTATDAQGATSAPANLAITITGTNDEPVAQAAMADVSEGGVVTGRVTATDADLGATVSYALVDPTNAPTGLSFNDDGTYRFDASSHDDLASGEVRTITVSYTATDDKGDSADASLTITITGTNDMPVAMASSIGAPAIVAFSSRVERLATPQIIEEDSVYLGQLEAQDADADATLTYALAGVAPVGFTLMADGSYSFDASSYDSLPAGETMEFSVAFVATDAQGATSAPANLVITLTGTNDTPAAQAAMVEVSEDGKVEGRVTATDADLGAEISFALTQPMTAPAGLTFNKDGSYSFDAGSYDSLTAGQVQTFMVGFTATDKEGAASESVLTITLTGTNDVPMAVASMKEATEDETVTGNVSGTDADKGEAATLSYALAGVAPVGFTLMADGKYSFDASSYDSLPAGETMEFSVAFVATDAQGATSAPANLAITITGTNDKPVAQAAMVDVSEDGVVSGRVTATDADLGAEINFALTQPMTAPAGLTFNPDGSYSFDAASYDSLAAGQVQTFMVGFTATDKEGAASESVLTLTITGTNDVPMAVASMKEATEDETVTGSVSGTDADAGEAATLSYALAGVAPVGFTLMADGKYSFDASSYDSLPAGETMEFSVAFMATDAQGATSAPANLVITLTGTNDTPAAQAAMVEVSEDGKVEGRVTATDADLGAEISFALKGDAPTGLTFNKDGSYSFDAASYDSLTAGQVQTFMVGFTATDKEGAASESVLTIVITGTNDVPMAVASMKEATEDETVTGSVSGTDADKGEAATLSYALAGVAPVGFTLMADGKYSFDASSYDSLPAGETMEFSVAFVATDAQGATSAPANLVITLTGTNDVPVAEAAMVSVSEDAVVFGQVSGMDADAGAVLTYALVDTANIPTGLTFKADGSYTFDAASYDSLGAGETEVITVAFVAKDAAGQSMDANLTITITGTNDTPVAMAATKTVDEDMSVTGSVMASDAEAGTLTYAAIGPVPVGLVLKSNGSYSFDAASYDSLPAGQTMVVNVAFVATDAQGATSAASNLAITITGTNDMPVAEAAVNAVSEDAVVAGQVTGMDADAGAVLTYVLTDPAPTGLTFKADGSYTFDASTYDSLGAGATEVITVAFVAKDAAGQSMPANLTITITGTNDTPVAMAATNVVEEGDTITGSVMASDAEAGTLTYSAVGPVPVGLVLNSNGSYSFDAASYDSLPAGQSLVITVPYKATDAQDGSSESVLAITITGTNDAPVAMAAQAAVSEDAVVAGQVHASDLDAGVVISYSLSAPAPAGLTFNADGTYTFDASSYDSLKAGATETLTVEFIANDGTATSKANLVIKITGTNDAPVAMAAAVTVAEDATTSGQLVASDADANDGARTFAVVGTAPVGLTLNTNGSYSFDAGSYDSLPAGQSLVITVPYKATDAQDGSSESVLAITITGTNDAPVAQAAMVAVSEDAVVAGQVHASDLDAGAVISYSLSAPSPAGLTFNADGTYTFDAASYDSLKAGATETLTVEFIANDGTATSKANLVIKITGTNDAPVAMAAAVTVAEDATTSGQLVASDADANDGARTFAVVGTAPVGLTLNTNGSYSFDAGSYDSLPAGQSLVITVPYKATDAQDGSSESVLAITITGTNDAPVAQAAMVAVSEDAVVAGQVHASDLDAGAVISYSLSAPSPAGLTFNADGTYTFDAASYDSLKAGATETLTVEFIANDGTDTSKANLVIKITGTNDAPVAMAAAVTVAEDASVTGQLVANDADANDGARTFAVVGAAPVGLTLNTNGSYSFDAASYDSLPAGQSMVITVPYKATDAQGASAESVLVLTLTGANDGPTVTSAMQSGTVTEDLSVSATGQVTVNDADLGARIVFSGDAAGTYGDFAVDSASGQWTYTLDAAKVDALGADVQRPESFTVTVTDEHGATATQTVSITVMGTNDGPVAVADVATVAEDATAAVTGNVLTNDSDVDAMDALSVSMVNGTAVPVNGAATVTTPHGTITLNADGSYSYAVNNASTAVQALQAGQTLTETIGYTVKDAIGLTATSTLTVTITGSNDTPVAALSTAAVGEDATVTGSVIGSDAEAGALSYAIVGTPPAGLTFQSNGSYSFDASSYDSLEATQTMVIDVPFTVTDAQGATSAQALLKITITGTNDVPVAQAAVNAVSEDGMVSGQLMATDAEAGNLTYAAVGSVPGLMVNANGSYTFDAASYDSLKAGEVMTVTAQYTATDAASGVSAPANLVITLTGTDDAPVVTTAMADASRTLDEDKSITGSVSATDADAGDTAGLTFSVLGTPPVGFTLNANGSYSFDAGSYDNLKAGTDLPLSVSYVAIDARGNVSAPASLAITVKGTNDGPVAMADAATVAEDALAAVTGNVLTNDSDVDAMDTLSVSMVNGAANKVGMAVDGTYGAVTIGTNGAYSYALTSSHLAVQALAVGQTLTETFSYTTRDAAGEVSTSTLTVTVTGTNDGPTILGTSTVAGAFTEDAAKQLTSGVVRFEDIDLRDLHIVSVEPASANTTAFGDFVLGGTSEAANAANGSVGWIYVLNNEAAQVLAQGQVSTEVYRVTVEDGQGGTVTQDVTVRITGTNDAPTVDASAATDFSETNGLQTLMQTGTVKFDDIDAIDVIDISARLTTDAVWSNGTMTAIDPDLKGKLEAGFTATATDAAAPGTVNWTYNPAAVNLDFLAEGESIILAFTVKATDNFNATATDVVTLTIKGTNDGPTVSVSNGPVAVTEAASATMQAIEASGTVSFGDIDFNDTVSISAAYSGDIAWTKPGAAVGDAMVPVTTAIPTTVVSALTAAANFMATATNAAAPGTTPWSYKASNTALDFLGKDEQLSFSYTVMATDNNGAMATTTVRVTVTGTNDDVLVTSAVASGAVVEDTTASATGTVNFIDADLTDNHVVTSAFTSTNYADSNARMGTFTAVETTDTTGSGTGGVVTWTYAIDSAAAQKLAKDQVVTEVHTITLNDQNGDTVTQDVTVTITGTNDDVLVSGVVVTGGVTEDDAALATATGTVNFTDVDLTDNHVVTAAFASTNYTDSAARMGNFSVVETADTTGTGTGGVATWTYQIDNAAAQKLAAGQTVTEVYTITVNDQKGDTTTQNVTVTITGTNDAPDVSVNPAPGFFKVEQFLGFWSQDLNTLINRASAVAPNFTVQAQVIDYSDNGGSGVLGGTSPWPAAAVSNDQFFARITSTFVVTTADNYTFRTFNDDGLFLKVDGQLLINDPGIHGQQAYQGSIQLTPGQHNLELYFFENQGGAQLELSVSGSNGVFELMGTPGGLFQGVSPSLPAVTLDEADAGLTAAGTLTLTDVDLLDTVDVTVDAVAADGPRGALTVEQLRGFLSITAGGDDNAATPGSVANVGWAFNSDSEAFNHLALNETLTLTYTVKATDSNSPTAGTDTQTVTITIRGTNDGPTAVSGSNGTVTEDTNVNGSDQLTTTVGAVFNDIDLSDTLSYSFAPAASNTLGGSLTLLDSNNSGTGASGSVNYTYTVPNSATQYLGAGDTATETFTITASDGKGGTVRQNVTVTVTGTNDAPVLSTFSIPGQVDATFTNNVDTAIPDAGQGSLVSYITVSGLHPATSLADLDLQINLNHTLPGELTATLTGPNGAVVPVTLFNRIGFDGSSYNAAYQSDGMRVVLDDEAVTGIQAAGASSANLIEGRYRPVAPLSAFDGINPNGTWTLTITDHIGADIGTVFDWSLIVDSTTVPTVYTATFSEATNAAAQDLSPFTGTFNITDADLGDTLSTSGAATVTLLDASGNAVSGFTLPDGATSLTAMSAMSFSPASQTSTGGTVSVGYTYDPVAANLDFLAQGQKLQITYQVKVNDGLADSNTLPVTITITGTNDGPVATVDAGTVKEAGVMNGGNDVEAGIASVTGNVLNNDTDADTGAVLSVADARTAAGTFGSVTIAADGSYTYTLDQTKANSLAQGDVRTDTFSYTVRDQFGATSTSSLNITVQGTNDAPVATADVAGGTARAFDTLSQSTGMIGSFGEPNTAYYGQTFVATASDLANIALRLPNASGSDAVEFKLLITEVNMTATGPQPGAVLFESGPQSVSVGSAGDVSVATGGLQLVAGRTYATVLDSYALRDGINGTSRVAASTANIDPNGQFFFLNVNSGDRAQHFQLDWNDGISSDMGLRLNYSGTGIQEAGVETGDNQALAGTASITGNVLTNDTDIDAGAVLTVADARTAVGTYGSVTIGGNGSYTYTLDQAKADSLAAGAEFNEVFSYTVTDQFGATSTSTLTVKVTGTNDAPVITNAATAQAGTVTEAGDLDNGDDVAGLPTVTGQLTATDVDAGATQAWSIQGTPSTTYGSIAIDLSTGLWTYTLNNTLAATQALKEGDVVTQTYTARVTDDKGAYVDQTITVTINGTNDAPVIANAATALLGTVTEAGDLDNGTDVAGMPTVTGQLAVTDVDAGATQTWSIEGTPSTTYGSIAINASTGLWTYTLDNTLAATQALKEGESVTQSYTARATDDKGAYVDQTITVTINGTNDAPLVSGAVTGSLDEDDANPATINLLANASDVDANDDLDVASVQVAVTQGSWTPAVSYSVNAETGALTLDPNQFNALGVNESLKLTFSYNVVDSFGAATPTTAVVTVTGSNDAPVVSAATTAQLFTASNGAWGALLETYGVWPTPNAEVSAGAGVAPVSRQFVAPEAGLYTLSFAVDNRGAVKVDGVELFNSVGFSDAEVVTRTVFLEVGAHDIDFAPANDGAGNPAGFALTIARPNGGALLWDTRSELASTPDFNAYSEDAPSATLQLLANASDPDRTDDVDTASVSVAVTTGTWTSAVAYTIDHETGALSFNPNQFNSLASGERLELTVTYNAVDGNGGITPTTAKVSIVGTNDAPVVSTVDVTGAVTETTGTPVAGVTLTDSGTIAFTDVDLSDVHRVTTPVPSDGALGTLTASVSTDTTGSGTGGVVTWNYSAPASAAEYLAAGQTKVESFTFNVEDGKGGSVERTVTVTLTGTNDGPVAVADTQAIVEGNGVYNGSVASNDSDVDQGTTLTYSRNIQQDLVDTSLTVLRSASVDGRQYFLVGNTNNTGIQPDALENQVRALGGHLASVGGTNENSTVLSLLQAAGVQRAYIGLSDAQSEGTFTWTDGTTSSYRNWAAGEPNNSSNEDFVEIYNFSGLAGQWNDIGSGMTYAVVEFNDANLFSLAANGSYSINANNASFDSLANGQTRDLKFNYTVSDGITSANSVLNVQVTGTNDAPDIQVLAGNKAAETLTETNVGLSTGGTLTVTDVDLNDTVSLVVDSLAVSGPLGALTEAQLKNYLSLSNANANPATPGSTGNVGWNFNSGSEAFNHLANGETLTLTYTVKATDSSPTAATDTQTVTITVRGTNDAVVITSAAQTGTVVEDGTATATGAVTFTDVDLTDVHQTGVTGTATYGSFELGTLTDTANGVGGSQPWTYRINSNKAQELADGQSVVETFTVSVTDNKGLTQTQEVKVTITGTNDTPTVTGSTNLSLTEDASTPDLTGAVSVNFADVDLTDVLSYTFVKASGSLGGTLSSPVVNDTGTGANGSVSYTYSVLNSATQSLRVGATATETFTITARDSAGATVSRDVTVTITGTNDAPRIDAANAAHLVTATVVESNETLSAMGRVVFTDVDVGDVVTLGRVMVNNQPVAPEVTATDVTLTPDQMAHLTGGFSIANPSTGAWAYNITSPDFLPAGSEVTLSYPVRVSDNAGGFVDRTVTVTVVGSNDAPVLTAGPRIDAAGIHYTVVDADNGTVLSAQVGSINVGTMFGTIANGTESTFLATEQATRDYAGVLRISDGMASADAQVFVGVGQQSAESQTVAGSHRGALYGFGGADSLTGGTGADYLDGGKDADSLVGGQGDDTYVVDDASSNTLDRVVELAGEGTDRVMSSSTVDQLYANVENLTLTGNDHLEATGNELANEIVGNAGNNLLKGGTGNAADTLIGSAGQDTLDGEGGADRLVGGAGDDTYMVDDAADVVVEGAGGGNDTVLASVSTTLSDDVENLVLTGSGNTAGTGNGGDNRLTGNDGANTLSGGGGADWLTGGKGADVLTGGAGHDTFVFGAGDTGLSISYTGGVPSVSGYDVVTDFGLGNAGDALEIVGAQAVAADGTYNGADSSLTIGEQALTQHTITNGVIVFGTAAGAPAAINSQADLAAAIEYLQLNDLGEAGTTVALTGTIDGRAHTWVYAQGTDGGTDAKDVLVDLVGVTANGVAVDAATAQQSSYIVIS